MSSLKRYTIEDMKKLAQKQGGKCFSKKYINANIKLKWQCALGRKLKGRGIDNTSLRGF